MNRFLKRGSYSYFLISALTSLSSSTGHSATVVYSNDVLGELEPCGCRSNPLGGMVRKEGLLKQSADTSLLQLDAGDLLFGTDVIPGALVDQSRLQATYLIKALGIIGQDAVVPGEKDFALGVKTFQELIKSSKIKFLAANLKKKNGKKLLEAHAVFERKKADGSPIRIAVIGIVGKNLGYPKELKISDPVTETKNEIKSLRKKADFLIVLSHQGLEADHDLAEKVPGIDLIIGAHSQSFLQKPLQVGKTWIYQSSFRNQYVGLIPIARPFTSEGHKLIGLDAKYEQVPSKLAALVSEFKAKLAEMNTQEEVKRMTSTEANSKGIQKFQTFPRCAECHLKQFDFWRKTSHANALDPLLPKNQLKNKECLSCHTLGLGDPDGYQTIGQIAEYRHLALPSPRPSPLLEEEEGSSDQQPVMMTEPLPLEEIAGYLKKVHESKDLSSKVVLHGDSPTSLRKSILGLGHSWAPVQCENCHQPGRDHPFQGSYAKKVEVQTCMKCHNAERAPEWYLPNGTPDQAKIAAKMQLIRCPIGDFIEPET